MLDARSATRPGTVVGEFWELMVEGGFGGRTQSQMLLGDRFWLGYHAR